MNTLGAQGDCGMTRAGQGDSLLTAPKYLYKNVSKHIHDTIHLSRRAWPLAPRRYGYRKLLLQTVLLGVAVSVLTIHCFIHQFTNGGSSNEELLQFKPVSPPKRR